MTTLSLTKQTPLYSGKSKTLYTTENPNYLIMVFRDDATAFNGIKKASLVRKGLVNNHFNAFIMQYLTEHGIFTQWVQMYTPTESIVRHLEMIRLESVIRNAAAGSLCKRFGIAKGQVLTPSTHEFFLKDDKLGDPLVNDAIIHTFHWATPEDITYIRETSLRINALLTHLFSQAGLLLVDFKVEFGRYKGQLYLGDEFTPDGCRIWDIQTQEILDKDLFRQDIGDTIMGYEKAAQRLGIAIPKTLS